MGFGLLFNIIMALGSTIYVQKEAEKMSQGNEEKKEVIKVLGLTTAAQFILIIVVSIIIDQFFSYDNNSLATTIWQLIFISTLVNIGQVFPFYFICKNEVLLKYFKSFLPTNNQPFYPVFE